MKNYKRLPAMDFAESVSKVLNSRPLKIVLFIGIQ